LLRQRGNRQQQPDQAQQPADGIGRKAAGDQATGTRVQPDGNGDDGIEADLSRAHLAGLRIQPGQHQRRHQHEHGRPC
jgi:hypothetical protein